MNRITKPQLLDMLALQNTLNRLVNPDWLTANYAWTRAIRVECAELSDHIGWKWWKKQDPNWPQARIELVDIWHFMLSSALVGSNGDPDSAATEMIKGLEFPHMAPMEIAGRVIVLNALTLHETIDTMSAFAGLGYTFPALFEKAMIGCGLSWEDLRKQYLAKNVLNIFRQRNGYKDGTYRKDWFGEEDNVWLEKWMAVHPDNDTDQLLDAMGYAYSEVLTGRTMA